MAEIIKTKLKPKDSEEKNIKLSSIKTNELPFQKNLQKYCFLIWDGLKFFSFTFDKLPRLRGKKKSFMDKLQNRKLMGSIIIFILIALWVIFKEFS